jgi:hypothetical protein
MENGDLVYVILFVGILMENARMASFFKLLWRPYQNACQLTFICWQNVHDVAIWYFETFQLAIWFTLIINNINISTWTTSALPDVELYPLPILVLSFDQAFGWFRLRHS